MMVMMTTTTTDKLFSVSLPGVGWWELGYSVVGIGARSFPKQGCFGANYFAPHYHRISS